MAFSASVKQSAYLGPSVKMTVGTWSGSAGDAAGTIVVSGFVYSSTFTKLDSDNTTQVVPRVSVSQSGNTSTLTVQNQDNVTTGRFVIIHSA